MLYGHLGNHVKTTVLFCTDCTYFVQQPLSKSMPKIWVVFLSSSSIFVSKITATLFLGKHAWFLCLEVRACCCTFFLDFFASSLGNTTSPLLYGFYASICVPINAAVPLLKSLHCCPPSNCSEKSLALLLSFSQSAHESINDLFPPFPPLT